MDKDETFTHVGSKFKINNTECMLDYGPQSKQMYSGTYSNYIQLHPSVSNSYSAASKRQLLMGVRLIYGADWTIMDRQSAMKMERAMAS